MSTHCAAELRPLDTMRQLSHFRNRRCLAKCRRRLDRAFALKSAEEASSVTFQIGGRGSRNQRPLPDRPPTLQAFRSVLSRTPSVSTQRPINGSRSYSRCHGVQSRGAPLSYHKPVPAVYSKKGKKSSQPPGSRRRSRGGRSRGRSRRAKRNRIARRAARRARDRR